MPTVQHLPERMKKESHNEFSKQTNRTRSYLTNFIHHIILWLWLVVSECVGDGKQQQN